MQIGNVSIDSPVALAPMAGVTDKPFRLLCKRLGAGWTMSEMATADPRLWHTTKSAHRLDHSGEPEPVSVQLAGSDPLRLAEAARRIVDGGADIIGINMCCPAKKVCNAWAGSALLADEPLVARICAAVVGAVKVPVTLKLRTGTDPGHINAVTIAHIAEDAGIAALAVHGRTRVQKYLGTAEYDTIAAVKARVAIPVFANGDVDSPAKARAVLAATRADGLMIGRAAQGRPWIFRTLAHFLATGVILPEPGPAEVCDILIGHLEDLYAFYGEAMGVRIARKHLGWYAKDRPENVAFRSVVNEAESASAQLHLTRNYFAALAAEAGAGLAAAA